MQPNLNPTQPQSQPHAHTLIYVHEEPTNIDPYLTVNLRPLTTAYSSI